MPDLILYRNKWLCSYETLLFNTPDGDIDIGQYARDGNGTGYFVRTKPKTEAQFDWVDLNYDVSKLKRVNVRSGHAYYDEFLTAVGAIYLWSKDSIHAGKDPSQLPSGSVIRIQSTQAKYNGLRYTKDYPQPSRIEMVSVLPPIEPILPSQPSRSIAFDATSNSGAKSNVSSYSWSHTCTGSNLILVVGHSHRNTGSDRTVTGITYNSVTLTSIRSDTASAVFARTAIYYMVAPDTGANTISVTLSDSTSTLVGGAVSYTGAVQSGQPDGNNGANGSGASPQTPTVDVTTVADNCWVFSVVVLTGTFASLTCNNTQRWNIGLSGAAGGGSDTNSPKTPAGSQTMSWTGTFTYTGYWAISAASFAPAVEEAPRHGFINFQDPGIV